MSKEIEKELLLGLNEKLDSLNEKVHRIDVTLVKQEVNLDKHMRRTEQNEENIEIFRIDIAPALDAYKYVATFIKFISTIFKISIPLITLLGIYYKYFKN